MDSFLHVPIHSNPFAIEQGIRTRDNHPHSLANAVAELEQRMDFRRLTGLAMIAGLAITMWESVLEAAPSQPTETRIIDNFEQLGIDTPTPRFGWVISDPARGALQSAYQIIVAPSQAALASGTHSVWDSGKVASSQQYGVVYAGTALEKTTEYWWKVRTWDAQGQVSPWSDACRFVTSFFAPGDWNSVTVWLGNPQTANPLSQFRKEFQINKAISGAYPISRDQQDTPAR